MRHMGYIIRYGGFYEFILSLRKLVEHSNHQKLLHLVQVSHQIAIGMKQLLGESKLNAQTINDSNIYH